MGNNLFPKLNYYPVVRNVNSFSATQNQFYVYGVSPTLSSNFFPNRPILSYSRPMPVVPYFHPIPVPAISYSNPIPSYTVTNHRIEIILIAILVLVSLDLVFVRSAKSRN